MCKQDGKGPKKAKAQGKSWLEQRADAVIRQPYKREPRLSWMDKALAEAELDKFSDNAEWDDVLEAGVA